MHILRHLFLLILLSANAFFIKAQGVDYLNDAPSSLEGGQEDLRALVLVSSSYGRPGIESFNRGLIQAWEQLGQSTDSLSVYYLDMNRGDKASTKQTLKQYILSRESGKEYDVVVLLQQDAVDFFLNDLSGDIAQGAPLAVAFASVDAQRLTQHHRRAVIPKNALEIAATVNTALELFPNTSRILFVTGNSDSDLAPVSDFLKHDIARYRDRVIFEHPTHLSLAQMKSMLGLLTPGTIVIRGSYGTDATQTNLGKTPIELGIELSKAASVPTFVLYETAIGNAPVIGGEVQRIADMGATLMKESIAFLHVQNRTLLEVSMLASSIYDYAEIQRYKGVISKIPQHAKVLNRPSSVWTDYKTEASLSIAFTLALLILVSGLLLERRTKRRMASRLALSQQQLQSVIDLAPHVAIQRYDQEGRIQDWNPASTLMYGWKKAEATGRTVRELIGGSHASDLLEQAMSQAGTGHIQPQHRKTVITKDGSPKEIITTCFSIPGHDGHKSFVSMDVDVSDLKRYEESLAQLASVFAHAREGIVITGLDGRVISVNDSLCRISGIAKDDIEGHHFSMFISRIIPSSAEIQSDIEKALTTDFHWRSEVSGIRPDGTEVFALVNINAAMDVNGEPKHYVCLMSEITELKKKQFALERLAHYDRLTDLPNRVLFAQKLHQAMKLAPGSGAKLAVLYIDLDGFKQINDAYGHGVGDQLLVELAKRMQVVLRSHDTIARLGGDEFAAVLPDLFLQDDIHQVLECLIDTVSKPVLLNARELRVTASVGVCFYQEGMMDADQLLRQADQAMYIAKQSGKNRYKVFDSEQERSAQAKNDELTRLHTALLNREFELFYQPKVDVHFGRVVGVEALIRWRHPERGLVPPGLFLPIIENHPLAIAVGEWVIEEALCQTERWFNDGYHIPVSVNVDGAQLAEEDFVEKLATAIARHPGLPRRILELEILESSALDRVGDIGDVIKHCTALGIDTSLDDFGTGYSTLSYLKELPVNTLKIDQSFIKNLTQDGNRSDVAIVQAILGLAHGFGRDVVVEGVETTEHMEVLKALGCDKMQGYSFAKPMPASELVPWMINWESSQSRV